MKNYKGLAFPKPDKKRRKKEKTRETRGRCEICGQPAMITPHHIVTRGAFGGNNENNLIDLCVYHHNEVHLGRWEFALKYRLIDRFKKVIGERKYHQWAVKNEKAV